MSLVALCSQIARGFQQAINMPKIGCVAGSMPVPTVDHIDVYMCCVLMRRDV